MMLVVFVLERSFKTIKVFMYLINVHTLVSRHLSRIYVYVEVNAEST